MLCWLVMSLARPTWLRMSVLWSSPMLTRKFFAFKRSLQLFRSVQERCRLSSKKLFAKLTRCTFIPFPILLIPTLRSTESSRSWDFLLHHVLICCPYLSFLLCIPFTGELWRGSSSCFWNCLSSFKSFLTKKKLTMKYYVSKYNETYRTKLMWSEISHFQFTFSYLAFSAIKVYSCCRYDGVPGSGPCLCILWLTLVWFRLIFSYYCIICCYCEFLYDSWLTALISRFTYHCIESAYSK